MRISSHHNHHSKHSTSQLDIWLEQLDPILKHINLHRFMWGFTCVCAFVAWNRGLMLLYGLVAFILAILLVSHIYRWLNLRGVQAHATFQDTHVFVGDTAGVTLAVQSRMTKRFLYVELPIVRKTMAFSQNFNKKTNGTHTDARNLLTDSPDLTPEYLLPVFILSTNADATFHCEALLRRGVYTLNQARLSCAYPFGMLESRALIQFSTDSLYVLPTGFKIDTLPLAAGKNNHSYHLMSSRRGSHDDITDMRPYRPGDAFKWVHWGVSAKQVSRGGDWIVKEFGSTDIPSLDIVLNPIQMTSDIAFDCMIQVSVAVATWFMTQGYAVRLFGYDPNAEDIHDLWQLNLMPSNNGLSLNVLQKLAMCDPLYHSSNLPTPQDRSNLRYTDTLQSVIQSSQSANTLLSFYPNNYTADAMLTELNTVSQFSAAPLSQLQIVIPSSISTESLPSDLNQSGHSQLSENCHRFIVPASSNTSELTQIFSANVNQDSTMPANSNFAQHSGQSHAFAHHPTDHAQGET